MDKTSGVIIKKCPKCGIEKSISEFHNNKKNTDNLSSYCKECNYEINRNNYQNHKEEYRKRAKLARDIKREEKKRYLEDNKQTIEEEKKKKQLERKERKKEMAKIRRANRTPEEKKIEAERIRKYRQDNPEATRKTRQKSYQNNRDKVIKRNTEYAKTEKGRAISRLKHQRKRIKIKEGDVTADELVELKSNINKCYWCNTKIIKNNYHIDHYVPLAKGGKHTIDNLVISCPTCNLKKNAKDPIQFANSIGKLF